MGGSADTVCPSSGQRRPGCRPPVCLRAAAGCRGPRAEHAGGWPCDAEGQPRRAKPMAMPSSKVRTAGLKKLLVERGMRGTSMSPSTKPAASGSVFRNLRLWEDFRVRYRWATENFQWCGFSFWRGEHARHGSIPPGFRGRLRSARYSSLDHQGATHGLFFRPRHVCPFQGRGPVAPRMFGPEHLDRLAAHAIGQRSVANAEGIEIGWIAGDHILDTDFDLAKNVVNDTLNFALHSRSASAARRQARFRRRARAVAPLSGASTPSDPSPGRKPCLPISRATPTAWRSPTRGSSRSTRQAWTFKWKDYRIKGRDRLRTMTLDAAEFIRRFLLHVLQNGIHCIRHMWTASWQVVFDALIALVGCGHMSGLLVRYRTAGPDDIRQSWSLSLRRALGSWRMSGCPGLSLRPCRSSRRCACQSLRN